NGSSAQEFSRQDRLYFGAGISASDLAFNKVGDDLVLDVGTGGDSITVSNWFVGDNLYQYRIDQFEFTDGTSMDVEALDSVALNVIGTDGNDILSGGDEADIMTGGDGDDVMDGGDGVDTYLGGEGDDILGGVFGSEDYYDYTYFEGRFLGNIYTGGTGNDTLYGAKYADDYYFNLGDGQDLIVENGSSAQEFSRQDRLYFGAGISASDLAFNKVGDDLVLDVGTGGDSITVSNWFVGDNLYQYRIDQFEFTDGTSMDVEALDSVALNVIGTDGDDILSGGDEADIMTGGDGDDVMDGGDGVDTYLGGEGDDTLGGVVGSDDYYGWDYVEGRYLGNVYTGGTGDDTLYGAKYADDYYFNLGDGQDLIVENGSSAQEFSRQDRLYFGAGISASDLAFNKVGDDLVLDVGTGGDSITVSNWFVGDNLYQYRIDQFEFSDSTYLDVAALNGVDLTVVGTTGDDTLIGGSGNDLLLGAEGADTYQYNRGEGQDTIVESTTSTSSDSLMMGAGIDALDISLKQFGADLQLKLSGSSDQVTIEDWFANSNSQVETIQVSDGSTLASSQVDLLIQDMATFSTNHNGISWDDALVQYEEETSTIIAAHWQTAA
ncbi:MAG: hypothetical protein HQL72_15755, partial [Magnetococcales bacterium]|nr:hypothetical protein [Magnetococcales bacterium]